MKIDAAEEKPCTENTKEEAEEVKAEAVAGESRIGVASGEITDSTMEGTDTGLGTSGTKAEGTSCVDAAMDENMKAEADVRKVAEGDMSDAQHVEPESSIQAPSSEVIMKPTPDSNAIPPVIEETAEQVETGE